MIHQVSEHAKVVFIIKNKAPDTDVMCREPYYQNR